MTIVQAFDPENPRHMAIWALFEQQFAIDDAMACQQLAEHFDPPLNSLTPLDEQWPQGWRLDIREKIRGF